MGSDQHDRPGAVGNAGAFLAPYGGVIPAPMHEIDPVEAWPPEPDDPNTAPPAPRRRSVLDILLHRNEPPPKDR